MSIERVRVPAERDPRWSEIRLIIHRPVGHYAAYAILERKHGRAGVQDVLVARGVFPCPPGSARSREWLTALQAALHWSEADTRA